ncbi:MAG: argininosuccinate lyase [Bacteroidetes bacterium]|nr:argininosuccinate lyase [Bacteroidota bacterium]
MTKKLWEKEQAKTPNWIEDFTIGKDKNLDLEIAEFDVIGSIAHAKMLAKVGLVPEKEVELLLTELNLILSDIYAGNFKIDEGVEDVHSQVELMLTQKLGDIGKKIHTARSRNDQVLVDLKLYIRENIKKTAQNIQQLFTLLIQKSEENKHIIIPGYTHQQAAMPSSFGLWFGAYAESLIDDFELLNAAFSVANKNPLGSGAGYGSSLPIDRSITTELLGFETMNYNVVYAQMTRGKTEKVTTMALSSVAATLSKLAMDICLYNSQNFGFVTFPDHYTTGSSIMPHKKNPDVFELIRGKCNRIQALPNEFTLLINNLPSGYHRDLQLTKEILFPAFKELNSCIYATTEMLKHIQLNDSIANEERYKYIYSVEEVNKMVLQGVSFRDAYKKIGQDIDNGTFAYDLNIQHSHQGSIGNLCLDEITKLFDEKIKRILG